MAKKQDQKYVDWDAVERDWRAGVKTKAQMSKEHGVSRAAMDKHFEKKGVVRDLVGKIQSAAATLVSQSVVQATTGAEPATERDIIEANAALQKSIILDHRRDIQRTRRICMTLLDELEFQTDNTDLLQELAELLCEPDEKGNNRRLEVFRKVMSLGSRVGSLKSLADALRSLVGLERQAFGLDNQEEQKADSAVEDVIRRVMEKNGA